MMLLGKAGRVAKQAAKWTLVGAGIARAGWGRSRCPQILTYHRVSDVCDQELAVTKEDFRWQMNWLQKHANVVSLEEVLNGQKTGDPDHPTVVLTFDDGYSDFADNALPVLLDHGFPSIVYVVPGAIEGEVTFWWDTNRTDHLLSWEQLGTIVGTGLVTVGSHSMYHHDLDALDPEEAEEDLVESRNTIVARLGTSCVHFSYPRGRFTDSLVAAAAKYYASAAAMTNGLPLTSPSPEVRWRFRRIPVQRSDGQHLFVQRVLGRLWLEELVRDEINRYLVRPRRNEHPPEGAIQPFPEGFRRFAK